ncbi:hypothetical protein D9757_003018 [Collybiopsis confluens]|uniref:Glycoside hydrolase family 44 catalytic domain-containing protein n=1 Tax=Collybiopsis confluens TaxID=2823264 RepID=A0A8H5MEN6_9AGAR|nr:hypothetical protein D9757_003018 [Collybiopsis confluens]
MTNMTVLQTNADVTVYAPGTGALASGWENWSWSSTLDFASTAGPGGTESISVDTQAFGALSTFAETAFDNNYAGLRFDISGAQPDVSISFSSSQNTISSPSLPLATLNNAVTTGAFTTLTVDFNDLPGNQGDRVNFQGGANGAIYFITNIVLLDVTPLFLSAEPLANNILAVTSQGAVNFSQVTAKINGGQVSLTRSATYSPPDTPSQTITSFTASSLVITAGNATFSYTIPAAKSVSYNIAKTTAISPDIYGVNFPPDADYIQLLGTTVNRWGGNAVTAYNPNGSFTNAGNDWFFENRVSDPGANPFLQMVSQAGSKSLFTIPADAGDGLLPNGSWVTPPPQSDVYTPWTIADAAAMLEAMPIKPDIVTVDNEIEIASSTHQDMHPDPMGFDEELARVIATSTMAKNTLPNVQVAAPSTCAWWFYWTSDIGYTDNAAHGNQDFIPWFLAQMNAASAKAGKRLLDFLDIHYYFAPDTSANDAAAKALRLRMTRSWFDPTYIDESWIGTSIPAQWTEPNPNAVMLIPRMQQLIKQFYPGTKLSVSEWSSTADTDITGGLVTADSLGIFGVYGLDQATYWAEPDQMGPVGLAFWLFRGNGTFFGSKSVPVTAPANSTNTLGVYASTTDGKKLTFVIINKDVAPVNLAISNIPAGKYFMRHFGGEAGVAKWQTTVNISANGNFIVPSYTAVFVQQQ